MSLFAMGEVLVVAGSFTGLSWFDDNPLSLVLPTLPGTALLIWWAESWEKSRGDGEGTTFLTALTGFGSLALVALPAMAIGAALASISN